MEKNNVVLIGMMGSGKSTIGKILADELSFKFIDTDNLIEEREGRIIAEIFAHDGEEHFRQIETEILKETFNEENCVIACGGGAVVEPRNYPIFREVKNVFYLDSPPRILYERISGDVSRPKLSTYEEFEKLSFDRKPMYFKCSKCAIRANRNPIEVVQDIMRYL